MLIATIMRNGACQPQWFERKRPSGSPRIWLAANAVCTTPMTRPRISIGKRSVVIAKTTEPMTPPKTPVTTRAASRSGSRREPAEHCAPREAHVEEEQELLAIEPVGKPRRNDARDRGGERVDRNDEAELPRRDLDRRISIAPSGERIMKSRMIVNWRKASRATTNFWYDEKAGGGPAWGRAGSGAAAGAEAETESGTGAETESLLMKSLSCPDAWMNERLNWSPNGSPSGSWRQVWMNVRL